MVVKEESLTKKRLRPLENVQRSGTLVSVKEESLTKKRLRLCTAPLIRAVAVCVKEESLTKKRLRLNHHLAVAGLDDLKSKKSR